MANQIFPTLIKSFSKVGNLISKPQLFPKLILFSVTWHSTSSRAREKKKNCNGKELETASDLKL